MHTKKKFKAKCKKAVSQQLSSVISKLTQMLFLPFTIKMQQKAISGAQYINRLKKNNQSINLN